MYHPQQQASWLIKNLLIISDRLRISPEQKEEGFIRSQRRSAFEAKPKNFTALEELTAPRKAAPQGPVTADTSVHIRAGVILSDVGVDREDWNAVCVVRGVADR